MTPAERAKEWRKKNPERVKAQQRYHRKVNGHRYHLKKHYGITEFQYDGMVVNQMGRCATCNVPHSLEVKLHVDHDHKTGKIRGLLCSGCNKALGCAKDDPETLRALAAYPERTR